MMDLKVFTVSGNGGTLDFSPLAGSLMMICDKGKLSVVFCGPGEVSSTVTTTIAMLKQSNPPWPSILDGNWICRGVTDLFAGTTTAVIWIFPDDFPGRIESIMKRWTYTSYLPVWQVGCF